MKRLEHSESAERGGIIESRGVQFRAQKLLHGVSCTIGETAVAILHRDGMKPIRMQQQPTGRGQSGRRAAFSGRMPKLDNEPKVLQCNWLKEALVPSLR